jgi:dihydrofolate reductase
MRRILLILVAAVAENGVIGQGGRMPWRLKAEMRHFRAATMGRPVVMGRKTYLPIGQPLKGRTNIVVSRDRQFQAPGVVVAPSLKSALAVAQGDALRRGVAEIAIIGGADIYAQTMRFADRLLISRVHMRPPGDTIFPPIDPTMWQETGRSEHAPEPGSEVGFTLITYDRIADAAAATIGGN